MRKGKAYLGIVVQIDRGPEHKTVEERFYFDQDRPQAWTMEEYRRRGNAVFVGFRELPACAQKRRDSSGKIFYSWNAEKDADALVRDAKKQEYYQHREQMTRAQAEARAAQARIEREQKKAAKAKAAAAEKAAKPKAAKKKKGDMSIEDVIGAL